MIYQGDMSVISGLGAIIRGLLEIEQQGMGWHRLLPIGGSGMRGPLTLGTRAYTWPLAPKP